MVCEAIRGFLRDYIDSFESLEVLLLLYRERTAWTADELCRRFKIRAPVVDDALASLVRAKLVNTTEQNVLTSYRYADEDLVRDALIASLELTYRDEPLQVIQLMSANAIERLRSGAIRAFADAFVFRKDKGRG